MKKIAGRWMSLNIVSIITITISLLLRYRQSEAFWGTVAPNSEDEFWDNIPTSLVGMF